MSLHVELASLAGRRRMLDAQIAQLTEERVGIDGRVVALQQSLQCPDYGPAAEDKELASRLAAIFLGDVSAHDYQICAACAMHAGRDVFVVQPAGRGKSLCYQIAGLMQPPPSTPHGPKPAQLIVVVSPLVALAHEQAAAINAARTYRMANGERVQSAYVLDGGDGGDILHALDGAAPTLEALVASLRGDGDGATPLHPGSPEALLLDRLQEPDENGDGTCVFVYVSPEKFARSHSCHAFLRTVYQLGLWRRTAVDEAHCVDEHGREFRFDYLLLGALRSAFPEVVLMCLTATAPPEVVVSTCLTLGITGDMLLLRGQLKRPRMRYVVHFLPDAGAKERLICEAVAAAHRRAESTLVYTNTRRATEQLADEMCTACNLPASAPEIDAYHAGMEPSRRRAIEAYWREGVVTQLSATIAMGMGMDKPDLPYVIHHQLPRSIGSLYQEASRAGRAGQDGRWDGFFTLADVFELLERRHGQLASGRAEHEYGWGSSIDLLRFLMDSETCRHVLFEQALGGGEHVDANLCCQPHQPQCDNCARAAAQGGDVVTLARAEWINALLAVMQEQEDALSSGETLSLRAFAHVWLRSPRAPTPLWVRPPLLLLALLHEVLSISFVEIRSLKDDDLLQSAKAVCRPLVGARLDRHARTTSRAHQPGPAIRPTACEHVAQRDGRRRL